MARMTGALGELKRVEAAARAAAEERRSTSGERIECCGMVPSLKPRHSVAEARVVTRHRQRRVRSGAAAAATAAAPRLGEGRACDTTACDSQELSKPNAMYAVCKTGHMRVHTTASSRSFEQLLRWNSSPLEATLLCKN